LTARRVVVQRGGRVESEHRFDWQPGDAGGRPVYLRSAAKPLQALPALRAGVIERLGLDDRHVAIACASHGGSAEHVARVGEILDACGLGVDDLACGAIAPRDPRVVIDGAARRIDHNCSGKHALGLALCVVEGWPTEGYVEAAHPLQRAMAASIADALGTDVSAQAIDGCGMQTYYAPLGALAGAFGRLAGGALGAEGIRIAGAMRAHPSLVAFDGAIDTELMRALPVVAKIGAEAVLAIGCLDGRGLAIKITDGAARALDPAAVWTVRSVLGLADGGALDALAEPEVRNSRDVVVGRLAVEVVSS
jgi:L-asparaginase II